MFQLAKAAEPTPPTVAEERREPRIVALVCNWCTYAGADMAGTARRACPAAVEEGRNAVMAQSYGPESRGGACKTEVILADGEIAYPRVVSPDVAVVLSQEAYRLAPLSNWALNLPGSGLVADYLLGIHRARSLPAFARPTFPDWFRRHVPAGDGSRGTVVLFHDTFMDFNYPPTGIAVTEILEKAGFRVELADMVCCGRPMISKGLLSQAAMHARLNVTRLYEHARRSVPIVGCEPSCLLALRDDYPELVEGRELREKARVVARQALLIDEFLGMLNAKGELGLTFREAEGDEREVLFHAHCHQKALAAPALSVELLRLAGYRAEMADAACCGMAGAYGYEKEHYEASWAAGERGLFPLIRARAEAQVAVMGTSCRQQIEHFIGRRPRHVVELLREALT
jgi:Fe-S oxidoreductase